MCEREGEREHAYVTGKRKTNPEKKGRKIEKKSLVKGTAHLVRPYQP